MISNGAALCLATNDLIEELGGKPTNFLDIQSGESEALDDILNAISVLEADDRVKCILINCFGGNLHMTDIIKGVIMQL